MKKHLSKHVFLAISLFFVHCTSKPTKTGYIPSQNISVRNENFQAKGNHVAFSTQGKYSTQIAAAILKQGGNLVDAAVASSFAISVERPQSTGLGGGGFFLFYEAQSKKVHAIDFRERAPLRATKNMYLDAKGNFIPEKSSEGITAVAVPGLVKGLAEIHQRFGKLPWKKVVEPAAVLAETGFAVYEELHRALVEQQELLRKDPAAKKIFLTPQGHPLPLGFILKQKDLAQSLRMIADKGASVFYEGSLARKILRFSQQQKGILTAQDLKDYRVHWREALHGQYADYDVYSMPPPSSGGIHVLQFLKMLEKDHLRKSGLLSARSIHLAASSLQSAFADRAQYLGDPDFIKVPTQNLLSRTYLAQRRSEIPEDHARTAVEVRAGAIPAHESLETTHFSMMDAEGNAIASTQTINGWMGASIVVPGTGIVLNSEMDDFSAKVGTQNIFGAVGGDANSIAPRKTPLSSMSPTLLVKDGTPQMAIGAPGGTRIISCVAQAILNVVEFQLPLDQAISSMRYHHQWMPDKLTLDPPGPAPEVLDQLRRMGYQIEIKPIPCKVMGVQRLPDVLHAVADPRDIGTAWAE